MMLYGFFASVLWLVATTMAAQAQVSDVPGFNDSGDFSSAQIQGNRGYYPQRQWVVIEPDQAGLNCRDNSGDVVVTLAYGAVIDSVFEGDDAVAWFNGRPWLKVSANALDLRRRVVNEVAVAHTCYVRANRRYIAPLNPDTQ